MLTGCPIEMENTLKVLCKALRRICNVKRELKFNRITNADSPKTKNPSLWKWVWLL